MSWIAKKYEKGLNAATGNVYVRVAYTNESDPKAGVLYEPYETRRVQSGWPDSLINTRLAELNGNDIDSIELGSVAPVEDKTVQGLAAWQAARAIWQRTTRLLIESNMTGVTQDDLDAAYKTMKDLYLPEFADYV